MKCNYLENLLNIENNLKEKIKNENVLRIIFYIVVIFFAIVIRIVAFRYQSGDYNAFLEPWSKKIIELGKIKSLKYSIGDYNVPYITLLTLFTYIPVKVIYPIKILSCIFDFVLAIFSSKLILEFIDNKKNSKFIADICFALVLFTPTVLLNSSVWGQCDSIYASFVVLSLYYMKKNKVLKSFIFLGIAFSFKLQSIFILPFYVILYFNKKNISLVHFLIIPLINFILCLPAIICGRGVKECMLIYFKQTGSYQNCITLNYPNLYMIFGKIFEKQGMMLVLFTFVILGIIIYCVLRKKINVFENYIQLCIITYLLTVFFLPYMHERYGFVVEIISIIYVLIYKKNLYLPIILQFGALSGYFSFLAVEFDYTWQKYFAVAQFICIVLFIIDCIKKENNKNIKDL